MGSFFLLEGLSKIGFCFNLIKIRHFFRFWRLFWIKYRSFSWNIFIISKRWLFKLSKKAVTFVLRIYNFSGIRSQSWQIRQNDVFRKNEKKIEKLTRQVIFFLIIVEEPHTNKWCHIRLLGIWLYRRFLVFNPKRSKTVFLGKRTLKLFFIKIQLEYKFWHCYWPGKKISCKSDEIWGL